MLIITPGLGEKVICFAGSSESAAPLVYYCMLLKIGLTYYKIGLTFYKIGLTYYKHDAKIFESEFCTSN